MIKQRTIGVDLAIAGAQVAQIYDDGEPRGRPIRFHLRSAELERFVRQVHEGVDEHTELIAVMEPTGMSWFPVASWLTRSGVSVWRVVSDRPNRATPRSA